MLGRKLPYNAKFKASTVIGLLFEITGIIPRSTKEVNESMYYIAETEKLFDRAVSDLELSVKKHGFGVLHIHDLGNTLRSKGVDFKEECKILEVCNP